jgi:hypothetical protein
LSRLELAWETLRVALRAIQAVAPEWYEAIIPAAFHNAYVERRSDWRLSADETAVGDRGHYLGADAQAWSPASPLSWAGQSAPAMLFTGAAANLKRLARAQAARRYGRGAGL